MACATWLHLAQGDVGVRDSLPFGRRFSHVLHAATDSTLGPRLSPLERYDQIVCGTRNVLDLAVHSRAQRFLLTSSGAVYGPQPPALTQIPENYHAMPDPLHTAHAYGVAKRTAEHLCALYFNAHGLQTVVARCFAFVGRDLPLDVHFAIGNFIRDALHRPAIFVQGDGSPVRSYLDQRDLAVWLTRLLQGGTAGEAYNVGSDQAITIASLASLVRDTLAPEKEVRIANADASPAGRNVYVPSIAKAQADLGLQVQVPLVEAIREAAQHVH
ncbi:MAG: UDP-glucose 4-epimerase, partial [Pseudomonas sp. PGPPP3]